MKNTKRPHRATGKPRGRPRKPEAESVIEARRYGPENDTEDGPVLVGPHNMLAMNEQQLRHFAHMNFGRRFQEGESLEAMRNDIRQRMDVGRFARYT